MDNNSIQSMDTWEILDYLRVKRNQHVLLNFSRDMYFNEFNIVFTEENWNEFLRYCDGVDNQLMFSRADKYINQWKGDTMINNFLD